MKLLVSYYQEQRNRKPRTDSDERSENTSSDKSKCSDEPLNHSRKSPKKKKRKKQESGWQKGNMERIKY
jgi:hypothetical protein